MGENKDAATVGGEGFAWVPPAVLDRYPDAVAVRPKEVRLFEVPQGACVTVACAKIKGRCPSFLNSDALVAYSGGKLSLGRAGQFDFDDDGDCPLFRVVWVSIEL